MTLPLDEAQKTTFEKEQFNFEFSARLATGDSLATVSSVSSSPSGVTITGSVISGTQIQATLDGGTDGQDYTMSAKALTTLGDKLEVQGILHVAD